MRLSRIEFNNFRCFYGKQELDLTWNDTGNVTLIHAQNGVGKTNLLNAILWTFYNYTTGKFEQKDKIINAEAEDEGKTSASVQIEFSFQNKNYRAVRFFDKSKSERERAANFRMWEIELDGNHRVIPHPEAFIDTIVPSEMAQYFFFDGEHAETFSGEKNASKVGEAVKRILGCEVAERAIEDLKAARKKYVDQMSKQVVGASTIQLTEDIDRLNREIASTKLNIGTASGSLGDMRQNIDDIQDRLRKNESSRELQKNYERTERSLATAKQSKEKADVAYFRWADTNALPLLSERLIAKTNDILKENKKINKIPSKYSGPLIEELLENEECICGSQLKPGTPTYNLIKSLLNEASDDDQIERYSRVQSQLGELRARKNSSKQQLVQLIDQRQTAIKNINDLETALEGLDKNYEKIDDEEINRLRRTKDEKERDYEQLVYNLKKSEADISEKENQIAQKQKELELAQKKQFANSIALRKKEALDQVIEHFETELEAHINSSRQVITHEVNKFLEVAASKSMKIAIDENFGLKVKFSNGKSLPKSGGENQLISLVFTAALVGHAKLRSKAEGQFLLPGTVAPLFLDAPFGQLDQDYQVQAAKLLPQLSDQLVLLLSNSQGNQKVLDALRPHVGSEFIIVRKNKDPQREGQPNHEIEINGKKYLRALYSEDHDCSEILRAD